MHISFECAGRYFEALVNRKHAEGFASRGATAAAPAEGEQLPDEDEEDEAELTTIEAGDWKTQVRVWLSMCRSISTPRSS